jgi:hypothetical protein
MGKKTIPPVTQLLIDAGKSLGFDVLTEVEASEGSAYVDVVWFDKRLPVGTKKPRMRRQPNIRSGSHKLQTGRPDWGFVSELRNISKMPWSDVCVAAPRSSATDRPPGICAPKGYVHVIDLSSVRVEASAPT